ncbi:MAG TPA: transcription elongation factor GreA [Anaerolineaceae bacterium]|jgi:transcription elongation factor GreA|nr:transcription elongation factor GreA [Anaerolineaceae bacterium]HQF45600.1 transcription elongation factor GreA [Anaerolineaceae bacterium]HQH34899.1 transcription elongation factor GreA [Anaerolineaceae bacterium]HQJ03125.1 transcription elongation factor GreA [Anaerolineaceae bacterium]HQP60088.1 transcription elongation factor GreA [Anaerolineaceae bacterium]
MTEAHYLTNDGLQRLQAELNYLKTTARDQLAKRLRTAIQQGDLSENADYIAAKEEQGFLEGRIMELEQIIRNVVIIDENQRNRDVVDIGASITIQEGNFPVETYQLVGPQEADPANGRISHESPIGKAMIGKRSGDEFLVSTPNGTIHFKIIKIE